MKVTINVSKDNIRYADMADARNCVIQRAITDSLPLATRVSVGVYDGHLCNVDGYVYGIKMPAHIAQYITRMLVFRAIVPIYLRWIFFRPFSFEMDVPDCFVAKEPDRADIFNADRIKTRQFPDPTIGSQLPHPEVKEVPAELPV